MKIATRIWPPVMTPEIAAEVLNLPTNASRADIDKQFRKQARAHHPDLFSGASADTLARATAEFVRMSTARDVLYRELDRVAPGATNRTDAPKPPPTPAAATRTPAAPPPRLRPRPPLPRRQHR